MVAILAILANLVTVATNSPSQAKLSKLIVFLLCMAGCVPLLGGIPALKPLLRQAFAISGRYGLRDIRLAALQILSEMYTGLGEK